MTQTPPSAPLLPSDRWQRSACRGWAPSLTLPQLPLALVLATGLITTTLLPVTLELTTLELLILCQRKKVMIWSCVSQMVEHGDIIEEFPAFSVHRAKHMHIHVAISGLDKI